MISQQNQPVRIAERQRPQQDAFDEREDRRDSAHAESKSKYNRQGKTGRLQQLSNCESEIPRDCVHASSNFGEKLRPKSERIREHQDRFFNRNGEGARDLQNR